MNECRYVLLLILNLSVAVFCQVDAKDRVCTSDVNFRFDCHPESGVTQEKCESRGCCWIPPENVDVDVKYPSCFYPKYYPGYYVVNTSRTPDGFTIFAARDTPSYYPNDVPLVRFDAKFIRNTHIHLRVYDPNNPRYEVPYFKDAVKDISFNPEDADFDFIVENPLDIKIIKKSTEELLYHIPNTFIFTDQFIQISSRLQSRYIYGLGERQERFLRSVNWQTFTMFASDQSPRINSNLYGSQPFFLSLSEDRSKAMGVVLINSNAMDIKLQPAPAITYRVLGGILDFHVFYGDSPSEVVSQYIKFIGAPPMPPFWSLGFHLCRWGYESSERTREVWEQTRKEGIPYDVQWNDIDYMDQQRDFTYDKDKFSGLPQLVKDIHEVGMHYVIIIDPAMDYTTTPNTYPPFDEGIKQDIFIKDANDSLFIGKVWSPNGAVYPDFTNPKTTDYWIQQLSEYHTKIPYDGLWIDMNEPSNFLDGTSSGCPDSPYENPPYLPNVNGGKLQHKTLCMTAKQNASIHYNVHNLYGFSEAIATNIALKNITNKRPFIISRSTFLGQGHYSGHWSGDNFATWEEMQASIPAVLDFNMFGIPLVGADICGFNSNTTVKLCQRWMELGAFYPFSRNHNTIGTIDQDPVSLGPEVIASSKAALSIRYALLPYLYTLFYRASVYGETVARPLLFEFPFDSYTFGIDSQFLWGSAIMILPVLEEDVTVKHAYFPDDTWYIYPTYQRIDSQGGINVSLHAPPGVVNIAVRAGYIIPFHYALPFTTTTESRKGKFGLNVYLNDNQSATGELFWDDGESIDTVENGNYNLLKFIAEKAILTTKVVHFGAPDEKMILGLVDVIGVKEAPTNVTVNGKEVNFSYAEEKHSLQIDASSASMKEEIVVSWQ